jgi:hypothetical protein
MIIDLFLLINLNAPGPGTAIRLPASLIPYAEKKISYTNSWRNATGVFVLYDQILAHAPVGCLHENGF